MQEITITIDKDELKTVRKKYLQLGREIEERDSWQNITHSHSKLGIFLSDIFGYELWNTILDMENNI